jgi:hypothetical protein
MLSNQLQRRTLLVFAAVAFSAATAFASPLTVTNFSFETLPLTGLPNGCGTGCSYSIGAIPGWTLSSSGGQFQQGTPANTTSFTSLSDGPTVAYTNATGGIISQTIVPTVVVGQVYTLRVDIGFRLDDSNVFAGTADLLINGNRYTATGASPVRGTFGTFVATYNGLLADVGKPITIELQSSGVQGDFDNVRLDASAAVPEPASFLLIGPALLLFSRRRRLANRG